VKEEAMGIDLATTTLWAELATWRPAALEVITQPQYWAVHGATRMGKALTNEDRLEDVALDASSLAAGVKSASEIMALLGRADGSRVSWSEPPPPSVSSGDEAREAIDAAGEWVERLSPEGLDLLTSVAHALQAGARLDRGASEREVRALIETPPRTATRPSGPFSSLLVASMDTLWVPVPLKSAWDTPACVFASSVQLAADLEALPDVLRHASLGASSDFRGAQGAVEAFEAALREAGQTHCIVMAT
jgi:hypothetical protein